MKNIKVKAFTWAKDSHKLFDYESSSLVLTKTVSAGNLVIARSNNEVIFHDSTKGELPQNYTALCNLNKDTEDRFYLTSVNSTVPLKLAIRSLNKAKGNKQIYQLKAGDKIQIGRVEYFVREIKCEKDGLTKTQNKIENEMDVEETKESKNCRICLEDEEIEDSDIQDIDKAFISPCQRYKQIRAC
eukprot:CAMPEP_0176461322 /NCGR_PEP_ID=MMETSP0127-20121128/34577_1 /TAXON_ID=938130 /ORGANISM="Platyophrya macrostoma, Strain WH" /LENGTH=185 /DNA_ID=CAMNT_0017852975 /DNA_START=24 /DNA_END=581 /DNA_ORIENTATION=-